MEQEINFKELLEAQKKEEERLMKIKPEVEINGTTYRLLFDLYAFEQIEEEYGGWREAMKALNGGKMIQNARKLFAILANAHRDANDMPTNVTGEEIPKHATIGLAVQISNAIKAAIFQGRYAETADGGPASDKKKNPIEAEYEAKNG